MGKMGLILSAISLIMVFFHYNIAFLIFSTAMIAFGIDNINLKNKAMGWIYILAGIFFIIGISLKGILWMSSYHFEYSKSGCFFMNFYYFQKKWMLSWGMLSLLRTSNNLLYCIKEFISDRREYHEIYFGSNVVWKA